MKNLIAILVAVSMVALLGCDAVHSANQGTPVSASGVKETRTTVQTDTNGRTIEQENIVKRLKVDNTPGSIKHLYIISPASGQCLLYSTVIGKVTSSGKRLTPTTVAAGFQEGPTRYNHWGVPVNIGGQQYNTSEVLQDDGTYGSSIEYLYWFDARGVYHQHYCTSCEIHISDQPMPVKNVVINIEAGVNIHGAKPIGETPK